MTVLPTSIHDTRLASTADRHPAATFFALALLVSWGLWIPLLATRPPVTEVHVLPGGFGPALAAVGLTWLRGNSIRAWLCDALDWRVGKRWYAVALGLPVVIGAAMGGLLVAAIGSVAVARLARMVSLYPVVLLFMTLVGGGQEELGWRGVALPALQERFDALTASAVVGVVWAVWHLPLFVFDVAGYGGRSFALYGTVVVGFAIVFTWLYNATGGSVLLAMVLHGGVNAASGLGGAFVGDPSGAGVPVLVAYGGPVWLVAGALVLWHGRETLSADAAVAGLGDGGFDDLDRAVPNTGRRVDDDLDAP